MSWRTAANRAWLDGLPGVERERPLARLTSFNIGGPAEWYVEAGRAELLEELVAGCVEREIPYLLLGAGTNLLVADAGVEGLVIRCENRDVHVEPGHRIRAGAGLKMMRLARHAAEHGLVGMEFAIGVPGSVGGAVYQDAGCWGREVREVLVEAEGWAPGCGHVRWTPADLGFGYRTSAFREGALRGALVESATFQLAPGDGDAARREMARLTAERNRSQPIKTKNCGSVFKNPPGDSAGRLVEAVGLKGARADGAQISDLHANFIVNHGGATAVDVLSLIEDARGRVKAQFGIDLEPEVEVVGRFSGGG